MKTIFRTAVLLMVLVLVLVISTIYQLRSYIPRDPAHKDDSRVWRLKDIQSFASVDPFHLRLSNAFETFNFDLKLPLEQATNDLLWKTVYTPDIPRPTGGDL